VNSTGGGCTGDINLIPHFGPLHGALIQGNLLGANIGSSFCTYGGAGVENPADHIVYKDNVFQRGTNGRCAAYGPVTDEQLLRARVLALFLCAVLALYGDHEGMPALRDEALAALDRAAC